jgi:hypothetical protein
VTLLAKSLAEISKHKLKLSYLIGFTEEIKAENTSVQSCNCKTLKVQRTAIFSAKNAYLVFSILQPVGGENKQVEYENLKL